MIDENLVHHDLVTELRLHETVCKNIRQGFSADLSRRAADAIEKLMKERDSLNEEYTKVIYAVMPRWILVKSRPMDEEERKEWSEKIGYDIEYEDAVIYTSQLPDDGQEVLTCNRYGTIAIDKFYSDPDLGCYFEENGDMDGIIAWMPLPDLPKDGEEDG